MQSTPMFATFWKLIQEYKIQIPIIQRDYAQGRRDERATSIRHKFLESLHGALDNEQPLDLDFVYGNIEDGRFIPLDGQQRLTTLFLLHWYLAAAENKLELARPFLERFTYETRSSSREFCTKLISNAPASFILEGEGKISLRLQDTTWFQPAWERDPTVQAMLVMLDAIQDKFGLSAFFDRLTDETFPLVRFHFLELKNAGLTDDLYLKMNARGKPLTDFENWKAEFDLFLQRNHPDLQSQFGQKMDGIWIDIFWPYKDSKLALVDKPFKRYLDFITRMTGLLQKTFTSNAIKNDNLLFRHYERVYAERKNVLFLFNTLDYLQKIGNAYDLSRNLFSITEGQTNRVRLFDGKDYLLRQCLLEENFDIKSQVLLYSLLHYVVSTEAFLVDISDVRDYLRVVRNLLERVSQQNDFVVNTNLREGELVDYLDAITKLTSTSNANLVSVYGALASEQSPKIIGFSQQSIEQERTKARLIQLHPDLKEVVHALEDLSVFRGDIHNLNLDENVVHLPSFEKAIQEIWSPNQASDLIIRAWLTQGDYSVKASSNTLMGSKYFYGSEEHWYTILSSNSDAVKILLPQFLLAYLAIDTGSPSEKLNHLIEIWLNDGPTKDWRYYFIKYPQITQGSKAYFARGYGFAMTLLTANSLKGKHIHPFVRAVVKLTPNGFFGEEGPHYITGFYESHLRFNISTMYAVVTNSGWKIVPSEGYDLPNELKDKYSIRLDNKNQFWLHETESLDMVKVMVAFATDLHEYSILNTNL